MRDTDTRGWGSSPRTDRGVHRDERECRLKRVEPHPAGTIACSCLVMGSRTSRMYVSRLRDVALVLLGPSDAQQHALVPESPRIAGLAGDRSMRSKDRTTYYKEQKKLIVSMGSLVRASLIHACGTFILLFFWFMVVRFYSRTFTFSLCSRTFSLSLPLFLSVSFTLFLSLSLLPSRDELVHVFRGLLECRCLSSSRS